MAKKSSRKRIDFDSFGIYHSHRQARLTRPTGGYNSLDNTKNLFRLAKPPIGYGPLIASTVAFVILINIFNVFLTISIALGVGAAFYFLLPDNRSRRLTNRAVGEELKGNKETAFQLLGKALALNPKNYRARNLKGFILAANGKYSAAAEELEKYFETAYDYNSVALLGRCYWNLGNVEQAIDLLKQLPNDIPKHFKSIAILGKAYIKNGEPHKAIEVLNKSLRSTKRDEIGEIDIRYALAEAYETVPNIGAARDQYRIILQKRTDDELAAERIKFLSKK
jgi:tetratricopeptide (TPR) repeat protein